MANKQTEKKKDNFIASQVLEGLAQYAFLHTPDKGNPKMRIPPAYKISLMLVDKEQQKKAKSLGLNVKPATEKIPHDYVDIKSRVKDDRPAPKVMDAKRNPIPSSILIGNGSRVRVRFLPFEYGEGEITAVLQETQVLDLVRYEGAGGKSEDLLPVEESGFSVDGEVNA
jgi:hypothetical protein